jgi:hypothetical protein
MSNIEIAKEKVNILTQYERRNHCIRNTSGVIVIYTKDLYLKANLPGAVDKFDVLTKNRRYC